MPRARCLQHEIVINGITLFESACPRERIKPLPPTRKTAGLARSPARFYQGLR
jgi:hypothetical protein